MSLLVAVLAAAGAGLAAGALWLRSRRQKRARPPAEPSRRGSTSDANGHTASAATAGAARPGGRELWLGLGDVVEIDGESHWLCAGSHLREAGLLRAGLWWPGPGRTGWIVVELPAPDRRVYLLREDPTPLPPGSPSRLELGGAVMDRRCSFPAVLEHAPSLPSGLSAQATVSLYEAASGAVAVVLQTSGGNLVAWGQSFELGEIDRLGHADPSDEEAAAQMPDPALPVHQRRA